MRKKREREAHLPGLTRAATRAGPVPQPAQPTSSSLVLFLLCQEDEQRRGVARVDAGHLLLRAGGLPLRVYPCVETPRSRPEPSSPPSPPLDPVPSSASLPARARAEPIAADAVTGATATPSLPLCVPELRPDPVKLPTRRTRPEEAAVDRSIIVFTSGARRSPPSIRRRRSLPEPAELLFRPHVSSCTFPYARPPCFSPLARFRRSRELIAAGHDASVVLATTARA